MDITLPTHVCNLALSRICSKRFVYSGDTETDLDANTTLEAKICNLNYEQTRDSLLRSHWWRFARKSVVLALDTETPPFEWDYQYILPEDFLRVISVYEGNMSNINLYSYAIEGDKLLTNETTVSLRYIRKVTDVKEFDPLFTEVLVLRLAWKLIPPLAGTKTAVFTEALKEEIKVVTRQVLAVDKQETNTVGVYELETWNNSRF